MKFLIFSILSFLAGLGMRIFLKLTDQQLTLTAGKSQWNHQVVIGVITVLMLGLALTQDVLYLYVVPWPTLGWLTWHVFLKES